MSRAGPAAAVAGLAAFLLAFGLGAGVVARLVPPPPVPEVDRKLGLVEEGRAFYDTLFVGSSRFLRGIDPRVFDAETAARGHPTRSFNLAARGMKPHEANALLRRVLALEPPKLRYVFVDFMEWSPWLQDANRYSARAVAWHDGPETVSVLRSTLRADAPLGEKLDFLALHLLHWGARQLRVGGAARALAPPSAAEGAGAGVAALRARRGYEPFTRSEYEEGIAGENRRSFLEAQGYADELAGLAQANAAEVPLDGYNVAALAAQVEAIRRAGCEPIYVIPPVAEPTPRLYRLAEAGLVPVLFAFGDPGRYPALYARDARFDRRHLNTEGAERFSRMLADRFVDWLEAR